MNLLQLTMILNKTTGTCHLPSNVLQLLAEGEWSNVSRRDAKRTKEYLDRLLHSLDTTLGDAEIRRNIENEIEEVESQLDELVAELDRLAGE